MLRTAIKRWVAVAVGAAALVCAAGSAGVSSKVWTSLGNFERHFSRLEQSEAAINPLERLLFSLLLTYSQPPQSEKPGRI